MPVIRGAKEPGHYIVEVATDLNGIVWLREKYEPETCKRPPRALDGSTNVFHDRRMYARSEELFQEQLAYLSTISSQSIALLRRDFENRRLPVPNRFDLRVRQIELAWHRIASTATAGAELALIIKTGESIYRNGFNVGPTNHKVALKGIRFLPSEGITLPVYLKQADLIRFEARWEHQAFKRGGAAEKTIASLRQHPIHINEFVSSVRTESWNFLSPLLRTDSSSIEKLSETAALAELSRIALKHAPSLLVRLREGDGRLTISSSEPVYRSIKALENEGILMRGGARGEYYIAPSHRSLIKSDAATPRALEAAGINESEPEPGK